MGAALAGVPAPRDRTAAIAAAMTGLRIALQPHTERGERRCIHVALFDDRKNRDSQTFCVGACVGDLLGGEAVVLKEPAVFGGVESVSRHWFLHCC